MKRVEHPRHSETKGVRAARPTRPRPRVLSARRAPSGHRVRRCAAVASEEALARGALTLESRRTSMSRHLAVLTLVPGRAQARTAL